MHSCLDTDIVQRFDLEDKLSSDYLFYKVFKMSYTEQTNLKYIPPHHCHHLGLYSWISPFSKKVGMLVH